MTYHVALILIVEADSPAEAAETAYRWCTDTEMGTDTEFHVLEASGDGEGEGDCPLLTAVEAVPGVAVYNGQGEALSGSV